MTKYDLSKSFDINRAKEKFNFYLEKGKKIELKIVREKRTIKQNNYCHVVISLFACEFGWTVEEAKTYLKREFGLVYEKNGSKFLRSTTELNTVEMVEFIEKIRLRASENGCYIPDPESYKQNQFEIDKYLEANSL